MSRHDSINLLNYSFFRNDSQQTQFDNNCETPFAANDISINECNYCNQKWSDDLVAYSNSSSVKFSTKFCRPKVERLIYNLKKSLLWFNESSNELNQHNDNHDKNLFDSNLIEWFVNIFEF